MEKVYRCDLNDHPEAVARKIKSAVSLIDGLSIRETEDGAVLSIAHTYGAAYGLGERFNRVNQKGLSVRTEVMEQFCNQDKVSYCPIPFFFTDHNLGIFVDTLTVSEFVFGEEITIILRRDSRNKLPALCFFTGTPKEILTEYARITGLPRIVPKWSFTPWMSANRWNKEEDIYSQVEQLEASGLSHGVMVIEAWSDEATFYHFNDSDRWSDPVEMIRFLKSKALHLILWQIPVIKKMDNGDRNELLDRDWEDAIGKGYCIQNSDGTPYTIPEGHWFAGSMLPDFTNPDAVKWWFDKRQYLLELGVDGFKTDGGEFVLTDEVTAANGNTGRELRNQFASCYIEEYSKFIGKDRVLFSRAGYTGQQTYPLQWAGDQSSTWEELRHILAAGLSIGLSGVPFWGFDISGFAGPMPTLQLYERATQLAVFAPIMQWHSEPVGGQFSEQYPAYDGINDRSPWNIGRIYADPMLPERLKFQYNLRMNLLPYLFNEALKSAETGCPIMKHLILEYPEDPSTYETEDCFMLGDLLVAPILGEDRISRNVYLPEGKWIGLWPMKAAEQDPREDRRCRCNMAQAGYELKAEHELQAEYDPQEMHAPQVEDDPQEEQKYHSLPGDSGLLRLEGKRNYIVECGLGRIPVFIREGGCLALNLDQSLQLGSCVGNQTMGYDHLCFYPAGDQGSYHFRDDLGNDIQILWNKRTHEAIRQTGNIEVHIIDKI